MKYSLRSFLLVLILTSTIGAVIYQAVTQVQRATSLANSRQLARFIAMDLRTYADIHEGKLPHAIERAKDGTPLHSWRFVSCRWLFGDMVQVGFYGQDSSSAYSHAWDHPKNKRYFDGPHRDYGGSPNSFIEPLNNDHSTRYAAITGKDAAFDENHDVLLEELDDDTILFVETRSSQHHWMEPGGDFNISTMPQTIGKPNGISGREPSGFIVAFADGQVWVLSNKTPFSVLEQFFTISGSKKQDRDKVLSEYRQ